MEYHSKGTPGRMEKINKRQGSLTVGETGARLVPELEPGIRVKVAK